MPKRIPLARILVVEDNIVTRMTIVDSLRQNGFSNVTDVADGGEAMEKLTTLEPDLVITDLMMPVMDGFSLCRHIRSHPSLQAIPILALTAIEDVKARLSVFDVGASDVVHKPITEDELIARCRLHLEKFFILKDLQEFQKRIEDDLGNARAMQNMLMPDMADIADAEFDYGLSISSLFAPSHTIGGDFWGIHPLGESQRLAVCIGDFTGHGVTAAINVFRLHTLFQKLKPQVLSRPAQCLTQLNAQLYSILPTQLFATMFYGVLDLRKNLLTYCIAGAPSPVRLPAANGYEVLPGHGLPLAAAENPHYHEYRTPFLPGDALLLYSDALVETPCKRDMYLDINHLGALLAAIPQAARNTELLLQKTLHLFASYAPNGIQDDLTLNIYMRKENKEGAAA